MAFNYETLKEENIRRYGTDIDRIGRILLAERYADRTHFIFELLQNAEDALSRRSDSPGSRSISFDLMDDELRVTHFGYPFDEHDVRGICGIAQSTKDFTAIGQFGIGFKSVYAFTDRPEVHSGAEDFAIESYVWPVAVAAIDRAPDETVIRIPLRDQDDFARVEIATGLERLGASALLFLRQIEEIRWRVKGGKSGLYLRESEKLDEDVRRVTVIGHVRDEAEVDQSWLTFSRPVVTADETRAGHVEIAFSLVEKVDSRSLCVQRLDQSFLIAYFPTAVETHLGFFVQGPYRTTPSRDNVPPSDSWNQRLVDETGLLLVKALRWMRDDGVLDTQTLQCLPLDRKKFGSESMFAPLFTATKKALLSERLLPRSDDGYTPAESARLARGQELRELFTSQQLASLFGQEGELAWVTGDITQDRNSNLRQYLVYELDVGEVTPETVVRKLNREFLESQPDAWILDLYGFLNGQPALWRRFGTLPLIRLDNGSHIAPGANGEPLAFLPGDTKTGFPTVREAVCRTDSAREFLRSLGLTEPDPVDDVVWNILPKYRSENVAVSDSEYKADIARILASFATDSNTQREKLVEALRASAFVMAIDTGNGSKQLSKPGEVYQSTDRLKELFADVSGIRMVDASLTFLRGEEMRNLLVACRSSRYLQPIDVETDLTREQRTEIRRKAGLERSTWDYGTSDKTLRGLDAVLSLLPRLDGESRRRRAQLLWDALSDLEDRNGSRPFLGQYTWSYSHMKKTADFPAACVRRLNDTAWVPDSNNELVRPEFITFDTLGWKPNPFLQSTISFKPPIVESLAREAGIEPGVLDLLKKHGVTSVAELTARLGISEESEEHDERTEPQTVDAAVDSVLGDAPKPTPPVPEASEPDGTGRGDGRVTGSRTTADASPKGTDGLATGGAGSGVPDDGTARASGKGLKQTPAGSGSRPFVSYIGTHPDEATHDPDGLEHESRMALEEKAITLILNVEPTLQRTKTHNPGFDLVEVDASDKPFRWVEVKAMTGTLDDRPVGMSHTQFEAAQKHGPSYWLYVVEHAESADAANIVRIQDPAGKAKTFTFDHGWRCVAEALVASGSKAPEDTP